MITVRQLRKTFQVRREGKGEVAALQGIDLEVGQGEFFVLLGPSGSGKTTLLRCVAGLEKPESGEIVLGSKTVFSSTREILVPAENRGLGMVFQSYAVWPHLTVFENVAMPLTHGTRRYPQATVREKVARALASVQLGGLENRPTPFLSGGQQQRVALARALAVEPQALLMDEPLSNLDARLREEVRLEIRAVAKKIGVTVLYVTHDQTEAMALADRIAVMDAGKILQLGSPTELYEKPASPKVAEFFGSINWLTGQVRAEGRVEVGIGTLQADSALSSGSVRVGIRPENLRMSATPSGLGNEFRGRAVDTIFLGDHQLCTVQIDSETLLVKTMGQHGTDCSGKDVYIHFPKRDILVYPKS